MCANGSSIAPSQREAPRWIRDGQSKQANAIVPSHSFKRTRDMFVERFLRFLVNLLMAAKFVRQLMICRFTRRLNHMITMVYFVHKSIQRLISFPLIHFIIENINRYGICVLCKLLLGSTPVSTIFEQFTKQTGQSALRKTFCFV